MHVPSNIGNARDAGEYMNNGRPLVSIAIPTYNRAETYLRPCLEAALRQTYSNLEIIVSDNGSSDGTEALVRHFADPRIQYYRQSQNIPPNDNFNFCMQQANGAYFCLLLDDELIDSDFVEVCIRAVGGRTDFGLLRTGLRAIDANGVVIEEMPNRVTGQSLSELVLAWFDARTAMYLCNTIFNRAALLALGGFRSRHNLFQDVVAQIRVAAQTPRADIVDVKATTRRHSGQFTYAAKVREWCVDSLDLLDLICLEAPENEALIRKRGARFFARICYSRANAIRSAAARLQAYRDVYQFFGHRYMPSPRLLLSSTGAYRSLRRIKRKMLQLPAWTD